MTGKQTGFAHVFSLLLLVTGLVLSVYLVQHRTNLFSRAATLNGTTYYVNFAADGAANNPTRPFNDPAYNVNDSFKTFTDAYNRAVSGDIIELSGGQNGYRYLTKSEALTKSLTIRGSTIDSYKGAVTIDSEDDQGNTASGQATLTIAADNVTLSNLTISRSFSSVTSANFAVRITKNHTTLNDVVIHANNPSAIAVSIATGSDNTVFNNFLIQNFGFDGHGINLESNAGTTTFNNGTIQGAVYYAVWVNADSTVNFNDCKFISTYEYVFYFNKGGTINTKNCQIFGGLILPHQIASGSPLNWNSSNDSINGSLPIIESREKIGFLTFYIDDRPNIAYAKSVAEMIKSTYHFPIGVFVETAGLTNTDKLNLQSIYKAGHEVGLHTRHHTDLKWKTPFKVKYLGSAGDVKLKVTEKGSTLFVTGSADSHGPINLTTSSYDNIGKLCGEIKKWTNFTCTVNGDSSGSVAPTVLSQGLKDNVYAIASNQEVEILFDDNPGADNRYLKDEITRGIEELESAIREDPTALTYSVKTFGFPTSGANEQVLSWIKANTKLIGVRANNYLGQAKDKIWLGGIDLYNIQLRPALVNVKGPNYSSLTDQEKQQRWQAAARVMAGFVGNGYYTGFGWHSAEDMNLSEIKWFFDELVRYKSSHYLKIDTFANLIGEIRNSGFWQIKDDWGTRDFGVLPEVTPTPPTTLTPVPSGVEVQVKIQAWGHPAKDPSGGYYPIIKLYDGGSILLKDFTVTATSRDTANVFTYTFPAGKTFTVKPVIRFLNDYCPKPCTHETDRNVFVDYINVNGITYQTEDPKVYSVGSWSNSLHCAPGYSQAEILACNGYFRYDQFGQ